ncbi:MAG: hypothetical protein WC256_12290 [Desulfurivibrionaceae bacterium]|jgi:glycerol dehydrogenase-like iron-containing ADH family enzyme
MNTILKAALTLSLVLILFSHAEADPKNAAESPTNSEPGVVVKVGKAIEHGVKAAANGVERGAKAAAHGIKHGIKAAAHGVEHGAKATENAASHVANKIDDQQPPAASPASGK